MIGTNIRITDNSVGAQSFLEFARNLPFLEIEEEPTPRKRTFEEAVAECNGRPASEFFDELRRQIKNHFKNA